MLKLLHALRKPLIAKKTLLQLADPVIPYKQFPDWVADWPANQALQLPSNRQLPLIHYMYP